MLEESKLGLFIIAAALQFSAPLTVSAEPTRPYFALFTEKSCMTKGQAAKSLAVFGDSLSTPYQLEKTKGYATQLGQYFNLSLKNYAVNGAETSAVLNQVKKAIQSKDISAGTLSIVLAGGNDFLRNRKNSETEKNLQLIIRELKSKGSKVILVGVPGKNLMALTGRLLDEELYKAIWESNQDIVFVPNLVSSVLSDHKLKLDAIHPNEQGHLAMYNSLRYDLFVWSSYCHKLQTQ